MSVIRGGGGFNGESHQLRDRREVYNAELFGIKHATQKFDTDTQTVRVFTNFTHRLHFIASKTTRGGRTSLYENGLYRRGGEICSRVPGHQGLPGKEADHWANLGGGGLYMVQAAASKSPFRCCFISFVSDF
jgi:hypothetical protein